MLSFKQYIKEMSQNIGPSTSNLDDDNFNKIMYDHSSSTHNPIDTVDGNTVAHFKKGKETKLSVLDHNNKRMAFSTTFERRPKSKKVPFSHNTQTYVGRDSKSPLRRGFGSDFVYQHLVHGKDVPLVSDEQQYEGGHKMWHRLIDRSFKEGHHAYLVDNGNLTKITPENKDEIMTSTYGKTPEFRNKRYAISKNPLE